MSQIMSRIPEGQDQTHHGRSGNSVQYREAPKPPELVPLGVFCSSKAESREELSRLWESQGNGGASSKGLCTPSIHPSLPIQPHALKPETLVARLPPGPLCRELATAAVVGVPGKPGCGVLVQLRPVLAASGEDAGFPSCCAGLVQNRRAWPQPVLPACALLPARGKWEGDREQRDLVKK